MEHCYDCGKPLTKKETTKEHIPAKNLFNGFPPEYKNNRLTVPACYECNQRYSKIDQEIRDTIGVMNNKEENQEELTRQAVKSILRRNDWKERVEKNERGDVVSVSFSYEELRQLHIKNFKGIFYDTYGYPVPDDFEIEIYANGDEEYEHLARGAQVMYDYINGFEDWKHSGHKDVFEYNIKTMIADANGNVGDNGDVINSFAVVGILNYHKKMNAIVVAARKVYLESVKKRMDAN